MSRQAPNIPAALYLRQLLLRNPQVGVASVVHDIKMAGLLQFFLEYANYICNKCDYIGNYESRLRHESNVRLNKTTSRRNGDLKFKSEGGGDATNFFCTRPKWPN